MFHKSDLKDFAKNNRRGQVFSFDLCDESGDIRVVAFDENAAATHSLIRLGRVYRIQSVDVMVVKDRTFNKLQHDYELRIGSNAVIDEVLDPSHVIDVPVINCTFRKIPTLEHARADDLVGM